MRQTRAAAEDIRKTMMGSIAIDSDARPLGTYCSAQWSEPWPRSKKEEADDHRSGAHLRPGGALTFRQCPSQQNAAWPQDAGSPRYRAEGIVSTA